ncbi:hypothetical protein GCM10008908_09480 [Clostridium subterminale]|uniref:Uncharacterized protein n=1 Tax=Clostridium subterminale TaxID=1550 RepID=A0ABN1KJH4_CLOSU
MMNYLVREAVNTYCPKTQKFDINEHCYSYKSYLKVAINLKYVLDNCLFNDDTLCNFIKELNKAISKSKKRYSNKYYTFEDELFDKLADHSITKSKFKKMNRKLRMIILQYKLSNVFKFNTNPTID